MLFYEIKGKVPVINVIKLSFRMFLIYASTFFGHTDHEPIRCVEYPLLHE